MKHIIVIFGFAFFTQLSYGKQQMDAAKMEIAAGVSAAFAQNAAEIEESNKIKLPNDGIFIHQAEANGGGILYLNKGKFECIQQD